jgi:hypothetical protein
MPTTHLRNWIRAPILILGAAVWFGSPAAWAQRLSGADLVHALQEGGYVLVVSNARSPEEVPPERERAPANSDGEREIDEHGQGEMSVMGYAFRELNVPVGQTLTSPAYRSRQSANYLGFGEQMSVDALAESADGPWLARRVTEAPPPGENTVIVTHGSLIRKALAGDARDLGTAETLIYRPREGNAELVARLAVEDWAKLAVN